MYSDHTLNMLNIINVVHISVQHDGLGMYIVVKYSSL